jgi:hypothetical protein
MSTSPAFAVTATACVQRKRALLAADDFDCINCGMSRAQLGEQSVFKKPKSVSFAE